MEGDDEATMGPVTRTEPCIGNQSLTRISLSCADTLRRLSYVFSNIILHFRYFRILDFGHRHDVYCFHRYECSIDLHVAADLLICSK